MENSVTYLFNNQQQVTYSDSANLTAFSRLRTAEAKLLGEYRYMYGTGTVYEMNDLTAGAGAITMDLARNCALATTTTANGDRAVRQTKKYHSYIAGTSNVCFITFTLNQPKTNLQQMVGLYDDNNGIFFRMNQTTAEVVIRKNSVDVEVVNQANWNKDKLDGSLNENPSGYAIDFTKSQILYIDYQWLGVGRVRMGFVINGLPIIVHEFYHSNIVTEVYMYQASFPCRWEIKNIGVTSSNSSMMFICAAVYCEGADSETGFLRSTSTGTSSVSVTSANSANGRIVLAFRLKNTLASKPNRAYAILKNYSIVSDQDLAFKLIVLPGSVALANSPTWSNVEGLGWCEYTKDAALSGTWTSLTYKVLDSQFAVGTTNNKSGSAISGLIENRTNAIYQNYDSSDSEILAIVAYRLNTDANVRASFQWLEMK